MFDNEKLLVQTPRFTVGFILMCLALHTAVYWGYLSPWNMILDVHAIQANPLNEIHRLATCLFICDNGTWKSILLMSVGLHVGTWFVISATKSRWQKMLLTFFYNYLAILLIAYFIAKPAHLNGGVPDELSFPCPQLALLIA